MTRLSFSLFSLYLACCLFNWQESIKRGPDRLTVHTHSFSGDLEIDLWLMPDWMGIVHGNDGRKEQRKSQGQTTGV
jgi:hypothetical protein